MKTILSIIRRFVLSLLVLANLIASLPAQEVSIPDPNFNAVVREALQKPNGPLTQLDMLGLTGLSAIFRNITNAQGLEAAQNLVSLDLQDNRITSLNFPTNLTRLVFLDLSENRFPQLTLPAGLTNLTTLRLENGSLTDLSLSAGLTNLTSLRVGFNKLSSLSLPADMTNLGLLSAYQNQLTNLTLPPNLIGLTNLILDGNQLSSLTLPSGMTKLDTLIVGANQLHSFTVPTDMTNLIFLRLNDNLLTNVTLPSGLNQLSLLLLSGNHLRNLALPTGMTNLATLNVSSNQLTDFTLPSDLNHLAQIDLTGNNLNSLALPPGLTSLAFLNLNNNQLTNITLPPDLKQLIGLFVAGNALTTFVLSEPLATTGLASVVDSLRNQGVSVFTYPLAVGLDSPRRTVTGAFEFTITGPPGNYAVLSSTNLTDFSALGTATNTLGSAIFTDSQAHLSEQRFYRARFLTPPTNMVFVSPNTFTMGSPTNEQGHNIFEGPQTTVTLTRSFWIGKFEVTQGEYLDITGTNPSDFPGDPSRSISSVTWFDATNYCWKLTQRELAEGRIPVGSQYRLPTEAEWECAARAGTTTRFSYGDDDANYTSLTNYAWFLDLGHPDLTVHPVGQKLPNPWGIYDVHGNVWEWCQDWYGDQVGGIQTDPTGPVSNQTGVKVIRGGAYDYDNSSCRSASRFFRFANWPDSDVGFRVVLVEP